MNLGAVPLTTDLVLFIDKVYEQNRTILHGNVIPIEEWYCAFSDDADPNEVNFIIMADNQPAAWLKINGLDGSEPTISMLVVSDPYKRRGVGSYAIHFAEEYIQRLGKPALFIYTTQDNEAAARCYLKNGYKIAEKMDYTVGDGLLRPGFKFRKDLAQS